MHSEIAGGKQLGSPTVQHYSTPVLLDFPTPLSSTKMVDCFYVIAHDVVI